MPSFFYFRGVVAGPEGAKNFMAPNAETNHLFFSSSLGKVFNLPEFRAKSFSDEKFASGWFIERQPLKIETLSSIIPCDLIHQILIPLMIL